MKSYLKFKIEDQPYAITLDVVEEILLLPELITIPDAPGDVIGILDRRSKTLPVIHLGKRLGVTQPQCTTTDNLIVINWQGTTVGVIVSNVEEVIEILEAGIDPIPSEVHPTISIFLEGVAHLDSDLLPLINPAHLIRSPKEVNALAELEINDIDQPQLGDFYAKYVVGAKEKDRNLFRQRRLDLAQVDRQERESEPISFALVEAVGETIGIPLDQIREFIDITHPTAIPFSPEFVVGHISLRGDILTLVDLSFVLGLTSSNRATNKAVVAGINQKTIGFAIDNVQNIIDISMSKLSSSTGRKPGIIGNILVDGKAVNMVDLSEILSHLLSKTNILRKG